MVKPKRRYRARLVLAPLAGWVVVLSRGRAAAKAAALATAIRLMNLVQQQHRPHAPAPSRSMTARERLITMIAIVVFAVAAQSAIFGLASGSADTATSLPRPRPLQRAAAPAARGHGPLLWVGMKANADYVTIGGTATITVQVIHTSADPRPADDVVITSVLPRELKLLSGPECNPTLTPETMTCRYDAATRTLTARMNALDVSRGVAQVTYVVRADDHLPCGSSLDNVAAVTWQESFAGEAKRAEAAMELSVTRGADGRCPMELPGIMFGEAAIEALRMPSVRGDQAAAAAVLEVPRLGISEMGIVDVPLVDGIWDISWLGDQAGWLETTTMPGQRGNSAITAHVTDIYGRDGPFAQLHTLGVGDAIVVRASGEESTYVVQSVREVAPDDLSILDASSLPLLTLLTCAEPNYTTHTYDARLVVQALMIRQDAQR